MRQLTKLQLVCLAILAIFCVSTASAFHPSKYATTSKLANGKWVKITIPENGVYELTYNELREMGFANPDQVKVFGSGGGRISEILNGNAPDDLVRVPMLRINNKICFYGVAAVTFSITDYSGSPNFIRALNPYSQVGCYFLSEDNYPDINPIKKATVTVNNYVNTPSSLGFFYHENERASVSYSGKDMLGEDFTNDRVFIDYNLPDLSDSLIVVRTVIAANVDQITYASAALHSGGVTDTVPYAVSSSRIYSPSGDYVYYNYASPFARLKLSKPAEQGQYEPFLKFSASNPNVSMSKLDYFILTYKHTNLLRADNGNQVLMGYGQTNGSERFQLPNAPAGTVVWGVNTPAQPVEVTTSTYNDLSGSGLCFFSTSANTSLYVAFNPNSTLKKISAYEYVNNQNLHGLATPDLVIITDKTLHEQAQRLADMHAAIDGIDVLVVDQDQVFNEFTSGTRDGMAYRLFCKMLYDRNNAKLKNLLLFGAGSFDNRGILGEHPQDLLTYQSDNSNYADFSFTSDDFFGFLGDNSGANIPADRLTIGVGRITSANPEEAKSDVDKIVRYYANPDYGVWRNNTMVMSDSPDKGLHMFQGEGYKNMIDNELLTGMHVSTVHNSMYPRSNTQPTVVPRRRDAVEANHKLSNLFKEGLYFATYVGHAGPVMFTKYSNTWKTSDVVTTKYDHFPIMTTACCDVAHFDNDTRGIAELMFHQPEGGAIALMTSSRMVYATHNDQLNKYFINAMFSHASTGKFLTLGEVYKQAKLGFEQSNANKLSFFLLGDPAMKINYPISRFNITSVNGTNMTDSTAIAQVSPLMKFNFTAQVVDADGNLDTSFNGNATATLYDKDDLFTDLTFAVDGVQVTRNIYKDRNKLTEVAGRVVNGVFNGTMIVPEAVLAKNANVLLRVYAHKENTDYMVNGFTKQIKMLPYSQTLAVNDNVAPAITSMFINDQNQFTDGATVGSSSMLYITATDNEGISVQPSTFDRTMSLVLDEGKNTYRDITCYAVVDDMGKLLNIEFPLDNIAEGIHTLTFTVYDIVGNKATRTITFMVGMNGQFELVADKMPAYLNGEVNFDLTSELTTSPEVIFRVTDATGNLVWMTKTSNFPLTWDMKDMNGNKVPAGLYRYFGTYDDGSNHGGTAIKKLIVLDPVKTAAQ